MSNAEGPTKAETQEGSNATHTPADAERIKESLPGEIPPINQRTRLNIKEIVALLERQDFLGRSR